VSYYDPRWYERYEQPEKNEPQDFAQHPDSVPPNGPTQPETSNVKTVVGEKALRRQRIMTQVVVTLGFMVIAFLGGWFGNQL